MLVMLLAPSLSSAKTFYQFLYIFLILSSKQMLNVIVNSKNTNIIFKTIVHIYYYTDEFKLLKTFKWVTKILHLDLVTDFSVSVLHMLS